MITYYLTVGIINFIVVIVCIAGITSKVERENHIVSWKAKKLPLIENVANVTKSIVLFAIPFVRLVPLVMILFHEEDIEDMINDNIYKKYEDIVYTEEEQKRRAWLHRNDYEDDLEDYDEDFIEDEEEVIED